MAGSAGGVRVTGFGRQRRIPLGRIAAALGALPGFHLEGLREIEYDPERLGQKATGYFLPPRVYTPLPNLGCAAEFLQDEEKIAVYRFASEEELLHLLYHEIGHHVCQRVLGGSARKRWVTEIHPRSGPVSAAGARNAREDFAECYALYVRDPGRLRAFPAKHAFLQDEVFRADRPR